MRLALIVVLPILMACSKDQAPYPECHSWECQEYHPIQLRIENTTNVDFATTMVSPGYGDPRDFGYVASGDTTEYLSFDGGYHYGFVQVVTVNNDTTYIQPIDYVGETPLSSGSYTYLLSFLGTGQNASLLVTCRKD